MDTKTIKAIELVMDWNLWPRQSVERLDCTNISRMRDALRNGITLPPIIVDKSTYKIIDGFHRTKAHLDVYGEGAEIEVLFKTYKDEAEMYLEAGRLNAAHGLPMSPKDKVHFILKARKLKIPPLAIAEALGTDVVEMKKFVKARTAKTMEGENVPLSYGAKAMAGKTLTKVQEYYVKHTNACVPEMYISMLINALKADGVIIKEKTIMKLKELNELIIALLDGVNNE
jgi:hypothetical protein